VRNGVLEGHPQAGLHAAIVWISMMDSDVLEAAQEAVNSFDDPRVANFFDPEQISGKAVAGSLGNPDEVTNQAPFGRMNPLLRWPGCTSSAIAGPIPPGCTSMKIWPTSFTKPWII
jgi:hypothetical protein